jgi:hypothetical protein
VGFLNPDRLFDMIDLDTQGFSLLKIDQPNFQNALDKNRILERISRIIQSARKNMVLSSIIIIIAISGLIIIESRNLVWAMGEAHSAGKSR